MIHRLISIGKVPFHNEITLHFSSCGRFAESSHRSAGCTLEKIRGENYSYYVNHFDIFYDCGTNKRIRNALYGDMLSSLEEEYIMLIDKYSKAINSLIFDKYSFLGLSRIISEYMFRKGLFDQMFLDE